MTLLSRRNFLLTGAAIGGTALVAAVGGVGYLATVDAHGLDGRLDGERAMLNAFVVVEPSGQVTINVPRTEMGQGIHTGLAMVVAEEMDLPFDDRIRVVFPTEALPAYANWTNVLGVRHRRVSWSAPNRRARPTTFAPGRGMRSRILAQDDPPRSSEDPHGRAPLRIGPQAARPP